MLSIPECIGATLFFLFGCTAVVGMAWCNIRDARHDRAERQNFLTRTGANRSIMNLRHEISWLHLHHIARQAGIKPTYDDE